MASASVDADLQVGRAPGVSGQQLPGDRPERGAIELRLRVRELGVETAHRSGVHAGAAVDREVAAVRTPEVQAERLVVERLRDQDARGLDRVGRQVERPRQDVRGASRDDAERGLGPGEGIDGLVDGPVTREDDHEVDALLDGLSGELVRVAALLRLGDLQPEVGGQRLLDDREGGLGHRPRDGIDDEQDVMEAHEGLRASMAGVGETCCRPNGAIRVRRSTEPEVPFLASWSPWDILVPWESIPQAGQPRTMSRSGPS